MRSPQHGRPAYFTSKLLVYFTSFRPIGATVSKVQVTILEEQHGLRASTYMYTHELADVRTGTDAHPKPMITSPFPP